MTGGSRRRRVARHGASASALAALAVAAACYSTGDGTPPPPDDLYFPVGLAVSKLGNVLYVANSDFDLQYNGGTVQSYDLTAIRNDALRLISGVPSSTYAYPFAPGVSSTQPCDPTQPPQLAPGGGVRLGWLCAPPMNNHAYVKDSVVVGAFATDLQLARLSMDRLFIPVRGNASLTWIDVAPDDGDSTHNPFVLQCDKDATGRCGGTHIAGNRPDEQGNTRGITMPGEPFGMAQTEDGQAIVITHQTDTKVSLLLSGIAQTSVLPDGGSPTFSHDSPSLQFVLDGLPGGGVGVVPVPHDPAAVPALPWPAFLWSSRQAAEIDLLRFHPDQGFTYDPTDAGTLAFADAQTIVSTTNRPYLIRERTFAVNSNSSGVDSRGMAIDRTPRLACEHDAMQVPGTTSSSPSFVACAQKPARVFIANRAPASIVLGEIGEPGPMGGDKYDPDHLVIFGNVPLDAGPSGVFLAPIIDKTGHYALRVFIVCFDSQKIFIYDPDAQRVENILKVGTAPYAMAFDPFDWTDVAIHAAAPTVDPNALPPELQPFGPMHKYRFAYLANFTTSFIQALDLDASFTTPDLTKVGASTFETIVFTLGTPTQPKGQ